jgi:hypothetical protein
MGLCRAMLDTTISPLIRSLALPFRATVGVDGSIRRTVRNTYAARYRTCNDERMVVIAHDAVLLRQGRPAAPLTHSISCASARERQETRCSTKGRTCNPFMPITSSPARNPSHPEDCKRWTLLREAVSSGTTAQKGEVRLPVFPSTEHLRTFLFLSYWPYVVTRSP